MQRNLSSIEDWGEIFGAIPFVQLDADEGLAQQITEARVGVELWWPALVLALLLLLAEMAVAWPRASELPEAGETGAAS